MESNNKSEKFIISPQSNFIYKYLNYFFYDKERNVFVDSVDSKNYKF